MASAQVIQQQSTVTTTEDKAGLSWCKTG